MYKSIILDPEGQPIEPIDPKEYDVIADPDTALSQEEYVTHEGLYCPICSTRGDLDCDGNLEPDGIYINQGVKCLACGAEFTDTYILSGYNYEEPGDA